MISRENHLFLVEDDADLRQMLARYLEQRQFGVTAMVTAEELLHRVARFEPDLILLDIGLPAWTDSVPVSGCASAACKCRCWS